MRRYSALTLVLALSLSSPAWARSMPMDDMDDEGGGMTGVLGPYPMNREASGTSWQPDSSPHMGAHTQRGSWLTMTHALINGVYDWQGGPRGDEKAFASGMVMSMAQRDVGRAGTLNLRAMLSLDPFMGKSGYPLLLATGETADGATPLVDRQHPHDLLMELSASYAQKLSGKDSVFVYAGLPGEPAFGPPAFMHRLTAMDSPEAPITHHWLDSTHITFGVLTGGWVHGDWKIEASAFRGREPDENRYDIESPKLDSGSVRLSWNPTKRLALQTSWAHLNSPEQLNPTEDETRRSGSAIYTAPFGDEGWWSTMLAVGVKRHSGHDLTGVALEGALHPNEEWTMFGRAEGIESDELGVPSIEQAQKVSLGAIRDFQINDDVKFGVGALISHDWVPSALNASYDSNQNGAMAFVRLKIGG